MKSFKTLIGGAAIAVAAFTFMAAPEAGACTRVIYHGADSLIVIGRSLDWMNPIPTNVYVYPRGMKKEGSDKAGAITWTSRYGAVYAVSYDAGITEGMNEKGLSVNGLFCKGTTYTNASNDNRAPISLAMFPGWILDLCATTQEARELLNGQNFSLYGATFDGGTTTTIHWGITDPTGDTMIVEFTGGVMYLYDVDGKKYPCMTNDPTWPSMTAIIDYWEKIGGEKALPGSVSSPDRCVRGNYFAKHVEPVTGADEGAAICRTVLNNSCVPYTYTLAAEGEPNVSMTQWRSFSNLRDLRYYFNMAIASGFWYVDLNKCDLRPGAPVVRMVPADHLDAVGDQTRNFQRVKPFTPMY